MQLFCLKMGLVAFVVLLSAPLLSYAQENSVPNYFDCPCPHLIAHRGASGSFPDSSILAFTKALEFGTDILELDVHLSEDEHIIVSHDDSLLRVTGSDLLIEHTTLEKIQAEDAGFNHKNAQEEFPFRGSGLKVLTLNELVKKFPKARFNIEIKPDSERLSNILEKFIQKHQLEERVIVASKHVAALENYRNQSVFKSNTSAHLNDILYAYFAWAFKRDLKKEPYSVLQIPYRFTNRSMVEYFQAQGKKVHVWTVNQPEDIKRMLVIGVDGVMTDFPELAYPIFVELGLKPPLSSEIKQ